MKGSKLVLTLSWIIVITTLLTLIVTLNKFGVITGQATDTAEANLTIQEQASISFAVNTVEWGQGFVNEGSSSGVLDTDAGNTDVTGFADVSAGNGGLEVQNDGNVNVTLNISANKNASDFIGGTSPAFEWKGQASGEAGSCTGSITPASYTSVPAVANTEVLVCADLAYSPDSADSVEVDLRLTLPEDALGFKTVTITAEGTAL